MAKLKMSPVSIGVCLGAVVSAGTAGGVYLFRSANHWANIYGYPVVVSGTDKPETLAWLSGFCFAAAVVAGLTGLWLAVRKRPRYQSAGRLLVAGGLPVSCAVVPMPKLVWNLEYLYNDEFGSKYLSNIVLFGCILLAAIGVIMVTSATIRTMTGDDPHKKRQPH